MSHPEFSRGGNQKGWKRMIFLRKSSASNHKIIAAAASKMPPPLLFYGFSVVLLRKTTEKPFLNQPFTNTWGDSCFLE